LVVIGLIYTSGGLSFSLFSIKIRNYFIIKPILILVSLFLLKILTDNKWKEFLKYILSIKGIAFCFLVSTAGLATGLFFYDMENTEIIIYYLTEGNISAFDFNNLVRYLLFHLVLFNSVWIIYSRIVSKSRSLPLSKILNKDGLIMSIGLLHLLPLMRYNVDIDPQYIFFFRVIIPGIIVAFKALMLKPINEKIKGSNYFKATIIASVAYFILLSILSIQKFETFRSHEDFPIALQSIWSTTQGRLLYLDWSAVPDIEGRSYLGSHFELILLFFVPLYALVKDPKVLLIIQSFILAMAMIPIYILAKDRLKNDYIGFSLALSYMLSPLIQRAHLWTFVSYSIIPFLTVLTFYFLLRKEFMKYFISLAALLLIKESSSIYIVLFGIYAFFFMKERKIGFFSILVGTLYFSLTTQILIPYFRGTTYTTFAERYGSIGGDLPTIIKNLISKPQFFLSLLTNRWSLTGWGYLLTPLAFLPLMSLQGLIMIIPTTSMLFLSNFIGMKYLGLHYPLAIIPFYYIGAILSLEYLLFKKRRWLPFIQRFRKKIGINSVITALGSFILTASLFFNYYFDSLQGEYSFKFDYWIGNFHLGTSPTGKHFNPDFYRMNEHDRIGKAFIKEIKEIIKDAPLAVEVRFASHFSDRFLIRSLHDPEWKRGEYVFFDMYGEPLEDLYDHKGVMIQILDKKEFGVVAERDGYILLRSGADPSKNIALIREILGRLEAEDMPSRTGSNIIDFNAVNKKARIGKSGIDKPDLLIFGNDMNLTKGNYRAIFRIKSRSCIQKDSIAIVEVMAEEGRNRLSEKELKCIDFSDRNGYKEFYLTFSLHKDAKVEPRVFFTSRQDLWIDKVTLIPD
jgi:uncharacterized membrane protein